MDSPGLFTQTQSTAIRAMKQDLAGTDIVSETAPQVAGFVGSAIRRLPMLICFQVPDYRWMWLSSLFSMTAMNMQMIARVWLVLRLMNDSPMAVVYITMTFAVPVVFVSLIGGALADRLPKRSMMIYAQSANALLTMVVATLDYAGVIAFWHLIIIGLFNGSLMAVNMPSRQAVLSEILPEHRLMNGIAMMNSAMNSTRIVGPAVAGVLIIYLGTAGVFYMVAGFYAVSVLAVSPLTSGRVPKARSGKGVTGDIGAGLAYAAASPILLGLIIMAFVPVMFGMSYHVLLAPWAREAMDIQSDGLGMLMMVMGVGALVGSLALASLSKLKSRGAFLLVCCAAWGIALAAFSQVNSYAAALPLLLFIGLASGIYMSLNMTMLQLYASPEMRGRIMSIAMMTFGLMPLSAVPFGIIAEHMGTPSALFLSGVLLTGFTVLFTLSYPRFRRIA